MFRGHVREPVLAVGNAHVVVRILCTSGDRHTRIQTARVGPIARSLCFRRQIAGCRARHSIDRAAKILLLRRKRLKRGQLEICQKHPRIVGRRRQGRHVGQRRLMRQWARFRRQAIEEDRGDNRTLLLSGARTCRTCRSCRAGGGSIGLNRGVTSGSRLAAGAVHERRRYDPLSLAVLGQLELLRLEVEDGLSVSIQDRDVDQHAGRRRPGDGWLGLAECERAGQAGDHEAGGELHKRPRCGRWRADYLPGGIWAQDRRSGQSHARPCRPGSGCTRFATVW